MGYGIEAKKNLKPNDLIMSIPMSIIMSRENILKQFPENERAIIDKIENDSHFLAINLLREKAKGSNSEYKEYMNVLPKNPKSALLFTDDELEELQNPESKKSLIYKREQAIAKFNGYSKAGYIDAFFYDMKDLISDYTKESDILWALTIVYGRSNTVNGNTYIVPLADFFNVDLDGRSNLVDPQKAYHDSHLIEDGFFNVYAIKDHYPGSQIFLDMGRLPNDLYFENYGIASINNPYDCINAGLPKLIKEDNPDYEDQKFLLEKFNYKEENITVCVRPAQVLRIRFQVYLMIRVMGKESIDHCKEVLKQYNDVINSTVVNECFFGPKSNVDRVEAYKEFVDYLQRGLENFPTTIEQDIKLLEYKDFSRNKLTTIKFRLSQKLAVNRSIEAINRVLLPKEKEPKKSYHLKLLDFFGWFKSFRPELKVEPHKIKDVRLGVTAMDDIVENEVIIAVPKEIIINQEAAQASAFADIIETIEEDRGAQDPFHEMLLMVLYEKYMNIDSPWKYYFDILPTKKEMNIPFLFKDEELERMKESLIYNKITSQKEKIEEKYEVLRKEILNVYSRSFPAEVFTYKNYLWVCALFESHVYDIDGKMNLLPMIDLVNAEPNPDKNKTITLRVSEDGKYIEMLSNKDFKKKEQVFVDYGEPNHRLFTKYGFVLENNIHDCYYMPLWVFADDKKYKEKTEILNKKGYFGEVEEFCINTDSLNTNEEFKFYYGVIVDINSQDKGEYYNSLHNTLQKRLNDYKTVLSEDIADLEKEKNPHKRTVLQFLISEKTLLKKIIKYLADKIDEEEL